MTNFKTSYLKIGSINIDKQYSISGQRFKVKISDNESAINLSALSHARVLSNLDKIKTLKEYYESFFNDINLTSSLDYSKIIGRKKSKKYINYLQEKIETTTPLITNYHSQIFKIRNECYKGFEKVTLNDEVLDRPVYDHSGVTGRTSIVKGFNFLTLKKEKRMSLQPHNKDNVLVEVDFKSCEPYFYLMAKNIEIEGNDVYAWICSKYKIQIEKREQVKRGILSMMYGANENTVSKVMKVKVSTIKKIKSDLGLYKLEEVLSEYFSEHNHFLNYYGRPITSNNNVVNYYIQSSAVDFCSLAFNEFCKEHNVKPSFFVHDSMTFQCKKEKLKEFLEIKHLKDPVSNIKIPVEFIVIGK